MIKIEHRFVEKLFLFGLISYEMYLSVSKQMNVTDILEQWN